MVMIPDTKADHHTVGTLMGVEATHAADFSWNHHGRGFLLSPAGMSGLTYGLTGIEVWKNGEVWASRHNYIGLMDEFYMEFGPMQEEGSDTITGTNPEFRAGLTISAADVFMAEWDWVLRRNLRELDPDVVSMQPYERSFRQRSWGSRGGGTFGESLGAFGANEDGYGPNVGGEGGPTGRLFYTSPHYAFGAGGSNPTEPFSGVFGPNDGPFGADTGGQWGDFTYDDSWTGDQPEGPGTPGTPLVPKFTWVGKEIDFGEQDSVKHVYIMLVANDCRQPVYVNVARKENVGQDGWFLDNWQRLNTSQASAGFSLAGTVFKPFVYVYQWEKFRMSPVTVKFKLVDRRFHHVTPNLVLEATQ